MFNSLDKSGLGSFDQSRKHSIILGDSQEAGVNISHIP